MTATFYDELAPYYHLIYEDWEQSVAKQGLALSTLLQESGVGPSDAVLDAACGIGTQTIGLLGHNYCLTASDISAGAIARLKNELASRELHADVHVDDIRHLARVRAGSMAALVACDNAIPHLLSDTEILQAFRSCHRCLEPGGVAVFSVRDYSSIVRRNPDVRPCGLRYEAGCRFLAVQVWEWDGDQYDMRMYLTSDSPSGVCETRVLTSRYYAVPFARLAELLAEAGFRDVQRRDDVLFQPVLLGKRPQ